MGRVEHGRKDIQIFGHALQVLPENFDIIFAPPGGDPENIKRQRDVILGYPLSGFPQELADDINFADFRGGVRINGVFCRSLGRESDIIELDLVHAGEGGRFGDQAVVKADFVKIGVGPLAALSVAVERPAAQMDPEIRPGKHQVVVLENDDPGRNNEPFLVQFVAEFRQPGAGSGFGFRGKLLLFRQLQIIAAQYLLGVDHQGVQARLLGLLFYLAESHRELRHIGGDVDAFIGDPLLFGQELAGKILEFEQEDQQQDQDKGQG